MFRLGIAEGVPETTSAPEIDKWLKKKNNWNPVCNASMAFAAIAAYEQDPELALRIIARSIRLVREVGIPEYAPDGNYPEGYTYWNYGTAYAVMLIDALEGVYGTSFGLADAPGFLRTPGISSNVDAGPRLLGLRRLYRARPAEHEEFLSDVLVRRPYR